MATQPPLTILGYDKDEEDSSLNVIRGKAQTNTRKIHDLQVQFDEARVRIDRLLSRKSRTRSDFDGGIYVPSLRTSRSIDVDTSEVSSTTTTTKVQIQMTPRTEQSFAPVTLKVNVNSDEEE